MTVEMFFANFGHLADAPNGVKKLRELILQLAVQGKLVPQDPEDEPASVLLERIQKEKASKGTARRALFSPVSPDETPYELPQGWQWVHFGDIAQHNAGKTLDKGRNTGQLRDYITTSNLYWGYFDLNNVRKMPIEDGELERCTARKGDLLIVEGGEAGRTAVWTEDYNVCFQNHIHRARFYCDIDPFYIHRFFEKLNLSGEISQYRKGVGISNMSGKSLASIVLPLPPLEEQKRIVAKVDQLITLCDELETRQKKQQQGRARLNNAALNKLLTVREPDEFADHWQRISTNFDLLYDHPETIAKLRAAILQLAVQGKLVPQDPNDEPAYTLLRKLPKDEVKVGRGKVAPLSEIPDSDLPYELPYGWGWVRLGRVVDIVGGSQPPKSKFIYKPKNGYTRLVQIRDFKSNANLTYVPNEFAIRPFKESDIMIGRYGPPVFQILKGLSGTYNVALMKADPKGGTIIREFLFYLLREPRIQKTVIDDSERTAGQSGVRKELLYAFVIGLPPLEEQKRIVAKVDQLMALCDELEIKLNQAQQRSKKLMEATVQQLLVA